eukprot:5055620-Alexandrium_andersonii.AAC.1
MPGGLCVGSGVSALTHCWCERTALCGQVCADCGTDAEQSRSGDKSTRDAAAQVGTRAADIAP